MVYDYKKIKRERLKQVYKVGRIRNSSKFFFDLLSTLKNNKDSKISTEILAEVSQQYNKILRWEEAELARLDRLLYRLSPKTK